MVPDPLRVLVVDDEPLARSVLVDALARRSEVGEVFEARGVEEALLLLERESLDLCYLDVEMPGGGGFEVLRQARHVPAGVVFVTAHEQYAVEAFDVDAIDYLLKPFQEQRFATSFARVLRSLRPAAPSRGYLERIACRTGGRTTWVEVSELQWIEAANSYVRLHTGERTHLMRAGITSLLQRLDPECFLRIHRSAVVHVDHVRELVGLEHGDGLVVLRGGQRLRLSRRRRAAVVEALSRR